MNKEQNPHLFSLLPLSYGDPHVDLLQLLPDAPHCRTFVASEIFKFTMQPRLLLQLLENWSQISNTGGIETCLVDESSIMDQDYDQGKSLRTIIKAVIILDQSQTARLMILSDEEKTCLVE